MHKSKTTAGFLALFLGMFGVHKFYLNEEGTGILYLMITMFLRGTGMIPISLILGVIDAVRIFSMSTKKFDAKYNKGAVKGGYTKRRRQNTRRQTRTERDMLQKRQRYQVQDVRQRQRKNPFITAARKKFKDFDLDGAEKDYLQAIEISPKTNKLYFELAQVYSLMEKPTQSLKYLDLAIRHGFKDTEKINTVDELAYLRVQDSFDKYRNNNFQLDREIKQQTQTIEPPKDNLLAQLNKLDELRRKGLLSEKEFAMEKEKLMRR